MVPLWAYAASDLQIHVLVFSAIKQASYDFLTLCPGQGRSDTDPLKAVGEPFKMCFKP